MSHNSRPFLPSETKRTELRPLHNTWRKFYDADGPPSHPPDAPYSFFSLSSGPSPPAHDWWGPSHSGSWQPPPVGDDTRRFNFAPPASGRGNILPPPQRGYEPLRPASPEFLERPWGAPRAEDWQTRPVTPLSERPLGKDHWSPGTASSSARDRDADWDRDPQGSRGWGGPRRTVSPSYSHTDRPLLEPSQAWKERERRFSIEQGPTSGPSSSNVPDLQTRRFHQPPPPPPLPGRGRYNDRFPLPPLARRTAPRRRQPRISARISARPNREPSPSSSESSARSLSRSSRSPYIHPGWRGTAEPGEDARFVESPHKGQPAFAAPPGPPSLPSSSFTFRHTRPPPRDLESPRRRRSASPLWSTQSSIRSSVHSSPRLVAAEMELVPPRKSSPAVADVEPAPAGAASQLQEDSEFELPGMRFLKDGALKPWLELPILKTGAEDGSTEKPVHKEPEGSVSSNVAKVEVEPTLPLTVSTEVAENHRVSDHSSPLEQVQPGALSPLSALPPSADHSLASLPVSQSSPLSQKQSVEPVPEEHNILQDKQKRDVAVEVQRQEISDAMPPDVIEPASVAPESSPLSEPMPLSPPPDVSELREDMDESSSMDVDNDSSLSSSSSGPADDIAAALRVFVRARDGKDLQTRSERYAPILRANHVLLDPPGTRIITSNEELVQEVLANTLPTRLEIHTAVAQTLFDRFTKQAEELTQRTQRLRTEYKSYHDQWVENCRKLDQSMASSALQSAEGLPMPSGRVTRRSAALGDTVRSDLEMEQIIASLGNEDMTDPNVLAIRNTAVIPDLVSTYPSAINMSFEDDNGLIDNPGEFFDAYDALGRWTEEEKQIFVQKYGVYPKQFGAIASFLPNKTATQCVMFYYLHKKELIDFRAAISKYGPKRKRKGGRKAGKGKGNALLADIVKPPRAGADGDGISHKHSGRFLQNSHDLERGCFPARPPPMAHNDEDSSHPLSIINVPRESRVTTLQQEENFGSDTESVPSKRQEQITPPVKFSVIEDVPEPVARRPKPNSMKGAPRIYIYPPPSGKRKEDAKKSTCRPPTSLQYAPVPPARKLAARKFIRPPIQAKRSTYSQRRVNPPGTISEDEGDAGTVAGPRDKGQAHVYHHLPEIQVLNTGQDKEKERQHEVAVESAGKPKQPEKTKEKEKRPPGRPPKKSKERSKPLEKAVSKSATSYVWSKAEEAFYLKLVARYGKDFEKIAGEMPAKTALQCRNYFRNHLKDLDLERIAGESNSSVILEKNVESSKSFASTPQEKLPRNLSKASVDVEPGPSFRQAIVEADDQSIRERKEFGPPMKGLRIEYRENQYRIVRQ